MVSVVPESINFAAAENEVFNLWKKIDAFRVALKQSEDDGRPKYVFFDGPPFATGLPHYGHILTSTIKDIVPRWAHMSGFHVERRFGWDTHGLPVEFEVDKMLGIKGPDDVMKMGIKAYNTECRSIVMRYAKEWEEIISRLGRWIDFKNDYKTLYPEFMESIWWVFKQLYNKGLVYNGVKVMPYSSACSTPLSNFESGQNYKDVVDPAVVVTFPLIDQPEVSLLAWTTTPWTLPSNLLLCVNEKLDYVKIKDKKTDQLYILMESRLEILYKKPADECEILERFPGAQLKGLKYKPIFDYFLDYAEENDGNVWLVATDDYVTSDSGTGIVHCAAFFGEDDYRVALKTGVIRKDGRVICPLDSSCCFTDPVTDFKGMYVKDADKEIIKMLKKQGRMIRDSTCKHSYPFCWRSDTPLIYRAVPSWFVRVEQYSDKLLESVSQTYWVPDFVKEKRFGNWLRDARDWAISRNRYWGTPIPLWISEDGEEIVCIGSIDELAELTGQRVTDLHRDTVDELTIPSKRPGYPPLKRVSEVFDCWFESGSMPYAQSHYPFENKKLFEDNFPANFIAEGVDQTRGWFYTLLVLSTLLFGKPPFKNLICNGLILASDGQKMSKRKKNYPDPMELVNKYGADALRLYLINSPVVRAENLRFREEGVRDILRDVFLPWFNAYRFLVQNMQIYEEQNSEMKFYFDKRQLVTSTNVMDRWILSFTQSLFKFVKEEMKAYRLYTVVPRLVKFVDNLTNWYVRMNRKRLKGENGAEDTRMALDTLFNVMLNMIEMMAPFTPFLTEHMFQNLRKVIIDGAILPGTKKSAQSNNNSNEIVTTKFESIHHILHQPIFEQMIDETVERQVGYMQTVIEVGRLLRDRRNVPLKYPLPEVVVITNCEQTIQDIDSLRSFILEELNVRDLKLTMDKESYGVQFTAEPDIKTLGLRLRNESKKVIAAIRKLTDEQLMKYKEDPDNFLVEGYKLESGDIRIKYTLSSSGLNANLTEKYEADSQNGILVLLNVCPDSTMKDEGTAREIINRVQKLRKEAKLVPSDPIRVFYRLMPPANGKESTDLVRVCADFAEFIQQSLKTDFIDLNQSQSSPAKVLIQSVCEIKDESIEIFIERLSGEKSSRPKPAPGPFTSFTNFQLKSGIRTVVKTFIGSNPTDQQLSVNETGGWSIAPDQTKPVDKYCNVEAIDSNGKTSKRGTVLLDTVTAASPYLAAKITNLDQLKNNVAVALNYHPTDLKAIFIDASLSDAYDSEQLSSHDDIVKNLDRQTIFVRHIR